MDNKKWSAELPAIDAMDLLSAYRFAAREIPEPVEATDEVRDEIRRINAVRRVAINILLEAILDRGRGCWQCLTTNGVRLDDAANAVCARFVPASPRGVQSTVTTATQVLAQLARSITNKCIDRYRSDKIHGPDDLPELGDEPVAEVTDSIEVAELADGHRRLWSEVIPSIARRFKATGIADPQEFWTQLVEELGRANARREILRTPLSDRHVPEDRHEVESWQHRVGLADYRKHWESSVLRHGQAVNKHVDFDRDEWLRPFETITIAEATMPRFPIGSLFRSPMDILEKRRSRALNLLSFGFHSYLTEGATLADYRTLHAALSEVCQNWVERAVNAGKGKEISLRDPALTEADWTPDPAAPDFLS